MLLKSVVVLLWSYLGLKGVGMTSNDTAMVAKKWNYDEELNWPGKCRNGGRRQSPIDIRTSNIVMDEYNEFIKSGPLNFKAYKGVLMTGVNNGLTIQFSTDGDKSIHPMLSGGPLMHNYRLEQMHFHWLSEHAVNGRKNSSHIPNRFPMEIHFVHVRSDLTVAKALKTKDGLAIIAIFCTVQTEPPEKTNIEEENRISEVVEVLPRLKTTGSRVSGVLLNLMQLIGADTENYYTYAGSLTSPECNEVVIWIILENPVTISDHQYRLFGKVGVSRHNFRSLQPVKQHIVYRPKSENWQTPYIVALFHDFMGKVTQFFKNVTRGVKRFG